MREGGSLVGKEGRSEGAREGGREGKREGGKREGHARTFEMYYTYR